MDVQSPAGARETGAPSSGQNVDDGKGLAQVLENENDENENDNNDVCALFATVMPRDVWANPSLAALAALIDEDREAEQEASEDELEARMDEEEEHSGSHQPTPRSGIPIATPTDEGAAAKPPGARPFQDAPSVPSTSGRSSGSAASGARCQRREDTRRRRNDRRASPYATSPAAAGRQGRGTGGPPGRNGGAGEPTRHRRSGPTPGETQVLMSLWGL